MPLHVGRFDLHRPRLPLEHARAVRSLPEDPPEHAGPLPPGARTVDADVEPPIIDGDVRRESERCRSEHPRVHHQHDYGGEPGFLAVRPDRALEQRGAWQPPGASQQVGSATEPVLERRRGVTHHGGVETNAGGQRRVAVVHPDQVDGAGGRKAFQGSLRRPAPAGREPELASDDVSRPAGHDAHRQAALVGGGHHLGHRAIPAGRQHQLEVPSRQGRPDRLDIEPGGGLQHHRLPAQLLGQL